jgi:hypothetical protein
MQTKTTQPWIIAAALMLIATIACNAPAQDTQPTTAPITGPIVTNAAGTPATAAAPTTDGLQPTPEAPATDPAAPTPSAGSGVLRVAFTKDADLWLWDEGGEARQVSTVGDVYTFNLSDDGQLVAFIRAPNFQDYEIWAVNADGSNERLLVGASDLALLKTNTDSEGVGVGLLEWIPGTHTIAYNTFESFMGPGAEHHNDLRLIDADANTKSVLLESGQSGETFTYSPDGTQIALTTPTAISMINADGSNRRDNLVTYTGIGMGEALYQPSPVWAADSSKIRVVIPSTGPYDPAVGPTAIWDITVAGSAVQIASIENAEMEPTLSPDLSRIAFMRPYGEQIDNTRELHIANADGSNDVVYISGGFLTFYNWARDGQRFVYNIDQGATQLGQVGADPVPLSTEGLQGLPIWVDGTRFLILHRNGDQEELRLGTAGGSSILIAQTDGTLGPYSLDFAQ